MSDTPEATTPDSERDQLRAKIEASERRIAERTLADQAKEAADSALEYTKANPLKVVGGAVVAGLLIGLMTRPGRRMASRAATGTAAAVSGAAATTTRAAKNATAEGTRLGNLISDAVIAFGIKLMDDAMDAGRAGKDAIEDAGDSAAARARSLRREASYLAGSAADKSRAVAQRTRRKASRAVRDLTN